MSDEASEQSEKRDTDSPALSALVESLLFIAPVPATIRELGRALDRSAGEVRKALEELDVQLRSSDRGLRLQRLGSEYALVTMPEAAGAVDRFTALATHTPLSRPALETLAIVAYEQPVTRGQIEAVRGVDCAHILRTLLGRELIEMRGHKPTLGRPRLYGVTEVFLQYFGMTSLDELPELEPAHRTKFADAMLDDSVLDAG